MPSSVPGRRAPAGDGSIAAPGLAPRARIAKSVTVAADPLEVLSGCVEATRTLLDGSGLTADDILNVLAAQDPEQALELEGWIKG